MKPIDWSLWDHVLTHVPDSGLLLEVGCGRGDFLRWLRQKRPVLALVGMDEREADIAHAQGVEATEGGRMGEVAPQGASGLNRSQRRRLSAQQGTKATGGRRLLINFVAASPYELRMPTGTAKVVYSEGLLEHLDEPVQALKEQRRVLRPRGKVVVHFSHDERVLTFGGVIGWLELAGFLVLGHSDIIPGEPTAHGLVWGEK